jgi:DNA polymerase I
MSRRVLLFDTSSLFIRAYHALPAMQTRSGQPTSALYGLSVQLLQMLREQAPLGIAFALDSPRPTFRHAEYADYKAHRPAQPDALRAQWPLLERWLEAIAAPRFAAPGFEADDILATLSREISAEGTPVRLVSGDRDLFQAVRPNVDVWFVGRRGQKPMLYDLAAVEARFGIPVQRLPSYVALIGDPSDNLPGLPGIGARTATKLIAEHGCIAALLDALSRIASPSLRESLSNARSQLLRNEALAQLRFDVPLSSGARFSALDGDSYARLRALFVELEFTSLLPRLERLRQGD